MPFHILHPDYTLDSFIPTKGSRQAHNAARYSHLFDSSRLARLILHGGPGVGKEHLLQGIAHHLSTHSIDFSFCNSRLLFDSVISLSATGQLSRRLEQLSKRPAWLLTDGDWLIEQLMEASQAAADVRDLLGAAQLVVLGTRRPVADSKLWLLGRRDQCDITQIRVCIEGVLDRAQLLKTIGERMKIQFSNAALHILSEQIPSNCRSIHNILFKIRASGESVPMIVDENAAHHVLQSYFSEMKSGGSGNL